MFRIRGAAMPGYFMPDKPWHPGLFHGLMAILENSSRWIAACIALIVSSACSTPVPVPTATPAAVPTAVQLPTRSPAAATDSELVSEKKKKYTSDSLFDSLLRPFVYQAQKQREERARNDSEYARRIDQTLNETRVNFLLYGYGESHEPPVTENATVGSNTIISYDTYTRQVDIISFTHDIRVPEVERELRTRGHKVRAVRMDQAYTVGGFRLMRKVLENMSGLSMDFQVTFKDAIILRLVDNVLGGLEIDVPESFEAHAFYLDGKKYPRAKFAKGKQTLNGNQVIQYIKTTPVTEDYYGKSLELNVRKHQIMQAILDSLHKHSSDQGFWLRVSAYVAAEVLTGAIVVDFDAVPLVTNNLTSLLSNFHQFIYRDKASGLGLPKMNKTKYIADPSNGDGGVRWVTGDSEHPFTKRDIQAGVYPEGFAVVIPFNADANGDLVDAYWPSVRTLIKKFLTEDEP